MPVAISKPELSHEPWTRPFLRWMGSKRSSIATIARHAPTNYNRYIEPFMGSASVFFALRPRQAVLNDRLQPLVRTFRVVRDHPRRVARLVATLAVSADYLGVRDAYSESLHDEEFAAHFIYLNAHCFNGLYRTNKSAKFNVPIGSRAGRLPSEAELYRASVALRRADLRCGSAWAVLDDVVSGDFVYLDPPYPSERPTFGEYGYHGFDHSDWARLFDELRRLDRVGATFLLSAPSTNLKIAGEVSHWAEIIPMRYRIGGTARARTTAEVLIGNGDAGLCQG